MKVRWIQGLAAPGSGGSGSGSSEARQLQALAVVSLGSSGGGPTAPGVVGAEQLWNPTVRAQQL